MPQFLITYVRSPLDKPSSDFIERLNAIAPIPVLSAQISAETEDDALQAFIAQDIEQARQIGEISIVVDWKELQ